MANDKVWYPWIFYAGNTALINETTPDQYGTTAGNGSDENTIPDILVSKLGHCNDYAIPGTTYLCPDESDDFYGVEGRYIACTRDLMIDGWSGVDLQTWNTYSGDGTDNGLSENWDGTFDSVSGCPFKGTNFDPGGVPFNLTAETSAGSNRRIGHDYWRAFFQNHDLINQPTGGDFQMDYVSPNAEPGTYDSDGAYFNSYRYWNKNSATSTALSNWPDHVQWIVAVDTHSKIQHGDRQRAHIDNKIYIYAKLESGFNGEGADSDLIQSAITDGTEVNVDVDGVPSPVVKLDFNIKLKCKPMFCLIDVMIPGLEI
tara:strand:- start:923 stop:1864 length:942 start_codon:yes stop_codon:yes gene_type:complete